MALLWYVPALSGDHDRRALVEFRSDGQPDHDRHWPVFAAVSRCPGQGGRGVYDHGYFLAGLAVGAAVCRPGRDRVGDGPVVRIAELWDPVTGAHGGCVLSADLRV